MKTTHSHMLCRLKRLIALIVIALTVHGCASGPTIV